MRSLFLIGPQMLSRIFRSNILTSFRLFCVNARVASLTCVIYNHTHIVRLVESCFSTYDFGYFLSDFDLVDVTPLRILPWRWTLVHYKWAYVGNLTCVRRDCLLHNTVVISMYMVIIIYFQSSLLCFII